LPRSAITAFISPTVDDESIQVARAQAGLRRVYFEAVPASRNAEHGLTAGCGSPKVSVRLDLRKTDAVFVPKKGRR